MAVNVVCPGCRTSYPITEDLVGKKIRCKKCQETFTATAAKSRSQDDRIQTRPNAAKAGRRDDDGPRGKGRTDTKKAGKGLLIGAGIGAVVLLIGGGIGAIILMNQSDTPAGNDQANASQNAGTNPLPISTTRTTPTPEDAKTDSGKAAADKAKTTTPDSAATFQPALNTFASATPIPKARPA